MYNWQDRKFLELDEIEGATRVNQRKMVEKKTEVRTIGNTPHLAQSSPAVTTCGAEVKGIPRPTLSFGRNRAILIEVELMIRDQPSGYEGLYEEP